MSTQQKLLIATWYADETAALENTVATLGLYTADEIEAMPANDNGAALAFPSDAQTFTALFGY